MRLYAIAAIALLTRVCSISGATASKITADHLPTPVHISDETHQKLPSHRLLRTVNTTQDNDEERVITAALEQLTGLVKTGASKVSENLKYWFTSEKQYASEILHLLKLDRGMDRVLTSPNLKELSKHLETLEANIPYSKASLIGTLTAYYGDDVVAKALVSVEQLAKTPSIAKEMQILRNDQLTAWRDGGKSIDDVFKLLRLRDDGYLALASPNLEVLADYIKVVNGKTSRQTSTLLKTLTKGFGGEDELAKVLVNAKTNPFTMDKAKELETALFNKWIKRNVFPESVLKNLRLDTGVRNALTNPNMNILDGYITVINRLDPSYKMSLAGTLAAHYGDDIVAKSLVSAKTTPATKRLATKLQTQQLEGWLDSGKSVNDVFITLKLKDDHVALLVSRKLETLDDYIRLFNKEKGGKETLITALSKGLGGEKSLAALLQGAKRDPRVVDSATKLQEMQFRQWLGEGLDSFTVFPNVFKIPAANVDEGAWQKTIVDQFKAFFEKELNVPVRVDPRRS